jgi:hypothetical protein
MMKATKSNLYIERTQALRALKNAIVEGAAWHYEHLVKVALELGATEEQVDTVAHDALCALLAGAEEPLNARSLAHEWPVGSIH